MGCCFSNDDDKNSQIGEVNERTRLLVNPASNNQARSSNYDEHGNHLSNSSQKGDEQSALSRILHQTAANVIDVSTLDAHNLEQHEYMDRAKQYSQRINSTLLKGQQYSNHHFLLADIANGERLVLSEPTSLADLQMIEKIADKVAKAVLEVKVEHKEELVVHFGIP